MSKRNSKAAKAARRAERGDVRTAKVPAPERMAPGRARIAVCPACHRGPRDLLPITGICAKCFEAYRQAAGV